MDIEKVIKGLECHHIDELNRINCADCPYYKEDDIAMGCLNSVHDDALALLKEQGEEVRNAYERGMETGRKIKW